MLPFKSLDAATTPGPGAVRDLEGVLSNHTIQAVVTGNPTSFTVRLQASLDGVTWNNIGAASQSTRLGPTDFPYAVRYVRAYLESLSGGTSPTVTTYIASAP